MFMVYTLRLRKILVLVLILMSVILYSLLTVYLQYSTLGLHYIEDGKQMERHLAVMNATAGNPWQYRILAEYVAEGIIQILRALNFPHYVAVAFISFRVIQNIFIFLTAYIYYRKYGLSIGKSIIGISLLAWGMTWAFYDSDLQFNTYFDIFFYLLGGLSIITNRYIWIIPITFFAALNRETSGLIPLMLLSSSLFHKDKKYQHSKITVSLLAITFFVICFVMLRIVYGKQVLVLPYGHYPGLDLLSYNLSNKATWVLLFATLGIIPFMAIIAYINWPNPLKAFFWTIVPIWIIIHFLGSVVAETRLFLVPQALVFIPGSLFFLDNQKELDVNYQEKLPT
jgi:hypothetical protein